MDFSELRASARAALDPSAWAYYEGTAGADADADRDCAAWQRYDLVPRVLRGVDEPNTRLTLPEALHRGGASLTTPIMVAATAGHGMADPMGECATARAAAATGMLMTYSHSATVDVSSFGASATGPWWVQLYLQRDRGRSRDYLDRAIAAGAGAVVLTADLAGPPSQSSFRQTTESRLTGTAGNFPGLAWHQLSSTYRTALTPGDVAELASSCGLPVYVKGVLQPADALAAIDAGAAGVVVSNHGRRQLPGVIPTADALGPVVDAVDGRAPVLVDGGIRSGLDVIRALALGAGLVGVGRPVLWGLAAGGEASVASVLQTLTGELFSIMGTIGCGRIADVTADLVRRRV